MNKCQNCGQINNSESNFCRFCGTRIVLPQEANDYSVQPRPYMWKTDEFQINNQAAPKTQEIKQVQRLLPPNLANPQMPQAMTYPQSAHFMAGYRCPRCGTQNLPFIQRQISTAGWITFAVLLVMTGIFFWIGLLIKEDVRVCSVCGLKTT